MHRALRRTKTYNLHAEQVINVNAHAYVSFFFFSLREAYIVRLDEESTSSYKKRKLLMDIM